MTLKSSVQSRESRYTQGGTADVYPTRLGWWERDLDINRLSTSDLIVTIAPKYDKRPDLFAFDYFGAATRMWVVLQYNSIVDINEEFRSGKIIRIPEPSRAVLNFFNKRTGGVRVI